MLWALLLAAVLAAACVSAVRLKTDRTGQQTGEAPARPAPAPAPAPGADPRTLEGKLTLELVRGQITGRQYQQAMATMAARDTERNPLDMPPDIAPPAPA